MLPKVEHVEPPELAEPPVPDKAPPTPSEIQRRAEAEKLEEVGRSSELSPT